MLRPVWIFVSVATLLFFLQANSLVFTIDEGILLEPAQRVLEGQRPYVDFFAYMSPGSYWLQALVFRVFGVSLSAARLVVILGLASQCAVLFWLTARLATGATAWGVTGLFLFFQGAVPGALTAQHRWDSAALATLSIAFCVWGESRAAFFWIFLAGMAAGFAALCTPSVALIAVVTLTWLAFSSRRMGALTAYLAGVAAVIAPAAAYMLSNGTLEPFVAQMRWLQLNYSSVNEMSYGSVNGGYASLFEGSTPFDFVIRAGLVMCVALPAILPLIDLSLWGLRLARKQVSEPRPIIYLLACTAAFVLATLPRPDVTHLAFAAVPAYALAAVWINRFLQPRTGARLCSAFAAAAAIFALNAAGVMVHQHATKSPVGEVRISPDDRAGVERLLATVRPGDALYVHPYLPLLYFLTQAHNPTRFAFLAPGMMTSKEEEATLADLSKRPPKWVLYLPVERAEFLRVFPSAKGVDPVFHKIERWITENYKPPSDPLTVANYALWVRKN